MIGTASSSPGAKAFESPVRSVFFRWLPSVALLISPRPSTVSSAPVSFTGRKSWISYSPTPNAFLQAAGSTHGAILQPPRDNPGWRPGCYPVRRVRPTLYPQSMPKLLEEIYRLQREFPDLDDRERLLLKMSANLFENYYEVKIPHNKLTFEEYEKVPGRWELIDGM